MLMSVVGPATTVSREVLLSTEVPSTFAVTVTSLATVPLWNWTTASPPASVSAVSTVAVPPKVPDPAGDSVNSTSTPEGTGWLSLSSTVAVIDAVSIPPVPFTWRSAVEAANEIEVTVGSTSSTVVDADIPVASGPL